MQFKVGDIVYIIPESYYKVLGVRPGQIEVTTFDKHDCYQGWCNISCFKLYRRGKLTNEERIKERETAHAT
jgi:hypothetical protein